MDRKVAILILLAVAMGVTPSASATRSPKARIAFAVQAGGRAGSQIGIYSIRPDGSARTRLTSGPDSLPKWAPGHEFIAYTRYTAEGTYLRVMTDKGEDDRLIARIGDRNSYGIGRYSWSPDGSLIAFQGLTDDGLTSDIFIASPDGSHVRNVTGRVGSEQEPAWSPDGSRLAFVGLGISDLDPFGSPSGIFSIDIDGTDLKQVTSSEGDFEPVWSPDGTKISFSSYRGDCCYNDPQSEGPYTSDVFVIDADGSGERQLTDDDCHWESGLFWLPDSSGIVYTAGDDDDGCLHPRDAEIRLVRLDGGKVNLTHNKRSDFGASLSPDGRWITYQSYGTEEGDLDPEIFVLSLRDGTRVRVTSNGWRIFDTSPDW